MDNHRQQVPFIMEIERDNNGRISKKIEQVAGEGVRTYNYRYDQGKRLAGRVPFAMTRNNQDFRLYYDQVGSLRVVADAHGNVIKETVYDSFGLIQKETNPGFIMPIGFAGGLHDQDTGWVRFGYRDYDPLTGRFTAKDPIGYAGGDSDVYGYCLDDPVNLVDPQGLEAEKADDDELAYCWTVTPKSGACENCQAMQGIKFMEEPERPHPNCKCKIERHEVQAAGSNDNRHDLNCSSYIEVVLPGLGSTILDVEFAQRVQAWRDLNAKIGINLVFSEGFRTTERQKKLGGNPNAITPAKPGTSLHEAGRAVDARIAKLSPEQLEQLLKNTKSIGLGWGGHFSKADRPHFYLEVPGGRGNRGKYIQQAQSCARKESLDYE